MRVLIATCAIGACIAGAAIAQTGSTELEFEREPVGRDYAEDYPRGAVNVGQEGIVVMCCTVLSDRTLDCEPRFEGPPGWGFADASVTVSRRFKMTTDSFEAYQAGPRAPLRRTIIWSLGNTSREWDGYVNLVREQTASLCLAPVGTAP